MGATVVLCGTHRALATHAALLLLHRPPLAQQAVADATADYGDLVADSTAVSAATGDGVAELTSSVARLVAKAHDARGTTLRHGVRVTAAAAWRDASLLAACSHGCCRTQKLRHGHRRKH